DQERVARAGSDPVADGGKVGSPRGLVTQSPGHLGGQLARLRVDDVRAAVLDGDASGNETVRRVRGEGLGEERAPAEPGQVGYGLQARLLWRAGRRRERGAGHGRRRALRQGETRDRRVE